MRSLLCLIILTLHLSAAEHLTEIPGEYHGVYDVMGMVDEFNNPVNNPDGTPLAYIKITSKTYTFRSTSIDTKRMGVLRFHPKGLAEAAVLIVRAEDGGECWYMLRWMEDAQGAPVLFTQAVTRDSAGELALATMAFLYRR